MGRTPVKLEIAAATDIGRSRRSNQDNFYANGCYIDHSCVTAESFNAVDKRSAHVLAVCDGIGGQANGDVAARIGVSTLSEYDELFKDALTSREASALADEFILDANRRIVEFGRRTGEKTGATMSMLVATSKFVYACNVGDSEIYHAGKDGSMERLSKPHTMAQEMMDRGELTERQARRSLQRHYIYQYLGLENQRDLAKNEASSYLRNGDVLMLCTDGVSDVLSDRLIYSSLNSDKPVEDIADALIKKALSGGSRDNLTVVIARVLDDGYMAQLKRRIAIMLGLMCGAAVFLALLLALL